MDPDPLWLLNLVGTAFFALSGAMSAGRKHLDLVGVVLVACVVAVGGGTLRDLLLGATPVFWVKHFAYLTVAACSGLAYFWLGRWWRPPWRTFLVFDAVGLGLFTMVGVDITLKLGWGGAGGGLSLSHGVAVLMGVLTAVGGGFLRDVICGEVPLVMRREIYALASLAGATVMVVMRDQGLPSPLPGLSCAGVVVALRLAGVFWNLHLPTFRGRPD